MDRKRVGKNAAGALVLGALLVCLGLLTWGVRRTVRAQTAAAAFKEAQLTAPEPTAEPLPAFEPVRQPSEAITWTGWMVHGVQTNGYQADPEHMIDFGLPEDYTQLEGIVTFRGNNFRNTSSYGAAALNTGRFGEYWTVETGGMSDGENFWGGSGWTGQPLVVRWPAETKRIMNMYDWAKAKEDLVEVIYATLAGRVYFLDLETGEPTRDSLYLGYPFKGAGALDPRGYPLMYLGGGVAGEREDNLPGLMIVSLIDGTVLYSDYSEDPFSPRPSWVAWDSSALVDAETDQLIYPGENGILYLLDLNTRYDPQAGTISIAPEEVKFTYQSSSVMEDYYGMEDSAIVWRGHLFIADNAASFLCIDLNTLQIEWRFDCLDDTNCTGVLELDETGHPYIYLSTSFHMGWRGTETVEIPVWKIDGVTGQEVWHHSYDCHTVADVSGGVQASLSLGTGPLDGILYVAVARCPDEENGKLVALDTATGQERWTYQSESYSWSTPVTFYDTNGNGYVLYTSCLDGTMHLMNGLTGQVLDTFSFGCTVEATPAVYDNTVVIGTRGEEIYGIKLE